MSNAELNAAYGLAAIQNQRIKRLEMENRVLDQIANEQQQEQKGMVLLAKRIISLGKWVA